MRQATVIMLIVLGAASTAWSQGKEVKEGEEKVGSREAKFNEVEYGFWLRSTLGAAMVIGDLFGSENGAPSAPVFPPGPALGVEMGIDLGTIASLHLSVQGFVISGTRDVTRGDKTETLSNDATGLLLSAGGRFDLMTTKRLAWFIKAGAGYLLASPDSAGLDSSVAVLGGTGIEYATALRHFTIGLEAVGQFLLAPKSVMVIVSPTVKYTF